jgi:ferritin
MDKRLIEALNAQVKHEFTNYIIYKNFSGIADFQSLTGSVSWFEKQSEEEKEHFETFYSFLCDVGEIPIMPAIEQQPNTNMSLLELFEKTVKLEKGTTDLLQKLYDLAVMLKEGTAIDLIEKYLFEQVEEVKLVGDVYNRLKLAGPGLGTIIIDAELGWR